MFFLPSSVLEKSGFLTTAKCFPLVSPALSGLEPGNSGCTGGTGSGLTVARGRGKVPV